MRCNKIKISVKTIAALFLVSILLTGSLAACKSGTNQGTDRQKVLNIGMVLGSAGRGDKSFNDSAYAGLLQAQKLYNIRFDVADFTSLESNLDSMRMYARSGYDLVIVIAYENLSNLQTVAKEFPQTKFAAIDFELKAENIASIIYREQEADFLMGVLSAMLTKTKKVCVIGGTDIPAIRRIMTGYEQGVRYQDSSVSVTADFAGTFSDAQVGYELAMKRYGEGIDIIHNAASRTGLGIIEAAKVSEKLTTGTSGDQRYLAPGNVVGNRPKRVDTAVLFVINEIKTGNFQPGTHSFGLKEDGLQLGPFDQAIVTQQMSSRLEELKQKIIDGEIIVQVAQ
jgi:basic membrane protein A and related proteins